MLFDDVEYQGDVVQILDYIQEDDKDQEDHDYHEELAGSSPNRQSQLSEYARDFFL